MVNRSIGSDVNLQVLALKEDYPHIYDCIDLTRVNDLSACTAGCIAGGRPRDHFGATASGGRGESYVEAQKSIATRMRGITQLVELIQRDNYAQSSIVADLLGGDGLVSRAVSAARLRDPVFVTCDASPFMVGAAWVQGIPALLQRAERPLFRTASVGGVLLAYGTHHIPPELRETVVAESFRILQHGGTFVLHDFSVGTPVETWFSEVVDVYSATGHDYIHFKPDEVDSLLRSSGFADVEVNSMDDSFVASAGTPEGAELELGKYLVHMYGLTGLAEAAGSPAAYRRAFDLAAEIFVYADDDGVVRRMRTEQDPAHGQWRVIMPRDALVGFGLKR